MEVLEVYAVGSQDPQTHQTPEQRSNGPKYPQTHGPIDTGLDAVSLKLTLYSRKFTSSCMPFAYFMHNITISTTKSFFEQD